MRIAIDTRRLPSILVALVLASFAGCDGCSCNDERGARTPVDGGDPGQAGSSAGAGRGGAGGTAGSSGNAAGAGGVAGAGGDGGAVAGAGGNTAGTGGTAGSGGAAGGAGAVAGSGGQAQAMCSTASPCSWKQLSPAASPPALAWAAMAWDAGNDRLLLFGGAASINGGALSDRTWTWNGSTWTELSPAHRPGARWTHGMVTDEMRQRIVLFGGLSSDQVGSGLAETWEWDGSDWVQVTTAAAPTPRGVHGALAYDSARRRVVLRGGGTFPGQAVFGDTWEYDGSNWTEVAGAGPSGRVAPAIVYDKARSQVLLFGGGTWGPYSGDTWAWNGSSWTQLSPGASPSARQSARLVYDPTRSLALLFGGDDGSLLRDLWEWNGSSWTKADDQGPSERCCYAYAHDPSRRALVLYGGPDNQTWVFSQ
jgi:hypothetical protein